MDSKFRFQALLSRRRTRDFLIMKGRDTILPGLTLVFHRGFINRTQVSIVQHSFSLNPHIRDTR